MTSTAAMETILFIEPIEIRIRYEAALAAKRLKVMSEWINQRYETHHQARFLDNATMTIADKRQVIEQIEAK
ncbi:hypothetical protein EVAR_74175_1 [Eumeta japonica]|uniref:Uncharacterized protein n=1 Tax=Eumeta variegata TaxID=151549 RepID=A0A4C1TIJ7_EUMVA|nr:hypothetical protein EVAR_74175_1 [Eumeta japonica]